MSSICCVRRAQGHGDESKVPEWKSMVELSSAQFGGRVLFATDDWFAVADNMIMPHDPVFIPDKFTEFGKWMDGWESRRKRIPGHDWAIVRLGLPGTVAGIEVSTAFFTGNFSPRVSIQVRPHTHVHHSPSPPPPSSLTRVNCARVRASRRVTHTLRRS